MDFLKALVVSSILAISGCGTWDLVGVQTAAYSTSPYTREQNLNELKEVIASRESSLDLRVFAHYSYAALNLGSLLPDAMPQGAHYVTNLDQANGYSLIKIDQELFDDSVRRANAKNSLLYVIDNLTRLRGTALVDSQQMRKSLTYAHYYLGLINNKDGDYSAAIERIGQFEQSPFITLEGRRLAQSARVEIEANISRIAQDEARRKKAAEDAAATMVSNEKRERQPAKSEPETARTVVHVDNYQYVEDLKKRFSSRLTYSTNNAYMAVKDFNIDCRLPDRRYLPLENLLLARIASLDGADAWLETFIDSRGNTIRAYDHLKYKDGATSEPRNTIEINEWGELRTYGFRAEAIMAACRGSTGPIWVPQSNDS